MTERPRYIVDSAARVGGIKANMSHPAEFLHENLQIQNNLIWSAKDAGVETFLFLGSSCIYPRACPQPMREEYLMEGKPEPTNEAYAYAKIAGMKLCEYIHTRVRDELHLLYADQRLWGRRQLQSRDVPCDPRSAAQDPPGKGTAVPTSPFGALDRAGVSSCMWTTWPMLLSGCSAAIRTAISQRRNRRGISSETWPSISAVWWATKEDCCSTLRSRTGCRENCWMSLGCTRPVGIIASGSMKD